MRCNHLYSRGQGAWLGDFAFVISDQNVSINSHTPHFHIYLRREISPSNARTVIMCTALQHTQ